MKKKLFAYLLLMLPALLMTSCLKDQEDIFDKSASLRSKEYLDNAKRVLTSAEYGWVLDFFPDRTQKYGGYSYTMKFDNNNVTVCAEEAISGDPTSTETTAYTLDNEDGPVIVFDTYNDLIHLFSTPHSGTGAGGYEAYGGDFIFIIMNISEDENTITLKGNRSGNILYMHRISETIVDYQLELSEFVENLVFDKAMANIDGKEYMLNIAADDRHVSIEPLVVVEEGGENVGDDEETFESIEAPFCFDKDGFSLYAPVNIGGKEVRVFKYDENEGTFIAQEDNSVVFTGLLLPSIVTNNIGTAISTSNAAAEMKYTFNLADKFTYTPTADWITVTTEGKNVTIHIAANTTGKPRTADIVVEANGEKAIISVTQIEVGDLVGSYTLKGRDSENADVAYESTLSKNSDGTYSLVISYVNNGTWPQNIQMTWNETESRFEMQSGQFLGMLSTRGYYNWLVFMNEASGTWTSTSTAYTGYLIPTLTADGGVALVLGGKYSSYTIDQLAFCVSQTESISGLLGYYDYFTNPVFEKK